VCGELVVDLIQRFTNLDGKSIRFGDIPRQLLKAPLEIRDGCSGISGSHPYAGLQSSPGNGLVARKPHPAQIKGRILLHELTSL